MTELNRIHNYVNESLDIEINTNTRKQEIVDGRFLFSKIARRCTELSLSNIGKYLNKDHASIIHGVKQFDNVLVLDDKFKALYETYVYNYLVRKVKEAKEDEQPKELIQLREIKNIEFKKLKDKIELLENINSKLLGENSNLKLKVKSEEPFLSEYYDLEPEEKKIVEDRVKLIIRMLPSKQKRKEVFEIINCAR